MKKGDWVKSGVICGTLHRLGKSKSTVKCGPDGPYLTVFNAQLTSATPGQVASKLGVDYAEAVEILRGQNEAQAT